MHIDRVECVPLSTAISKNHRTAVHRMRTGQVASNVNIDWMSRLSSLASC